MGDIDIFWYAIIVKQKYHDYHDYYLDYSYIKNCLKTLPCHDKCQLSRYCTIINSLSRLLLVVKTVRYIQKPVPNGKSYNLGAPYLPNDPPPNRKLGAVDCWLLTESESWQA